MKPKWVFTDDPEDPCALCVSWTDVDPGHEDDALPVWPDGSVAPRIYRYTHRECDEAVAQYVAEAAAEMRA